MSQLGLYTVVSNVSLTQSVYHMILSGDTKAITKPGQFINIQLEGLYLRRPISICDYDDNTISLLYKVVGKGTKQMSQLQPGAMLDCLVGLGNGYDVDVLGKEVVLVGGGVGIPPLYRLAKDCIAKGKAVHVVLGFQSMCEAFYVDEFEALQAKVSIATMDGSSGKKGLVTDVLQALELTTLPYCACGPENMLLALVKCMQAEGQLSFEARMGCGFGACMGCSCKTITGYKRICVEGPILSSKEVIR